MLMPRILGLGCKRFVILACSVLLRNLKRQSGILPEVGVTDATPTSHNASGFISCHFFLSTMQLFLFLTALLMKKDSIVLCDANMTRALR